MNKTVKLTALAATLMTTSVLAQEENPAHSNGHLTWRESTIARCMQQYSAEHCQDSEFLEANFHINSLETAHRAATRRGQQAQHALRELTLQRVCSVSASDNCASDTNAAQCIVQIEKACVTLKAEAENCIRSVQSTCASDANPSACGQRRLALCPSLKKQSIEQLLAKYPRLNAAEKSRLMAAAAELDAKPSNWWLNVADWLKVPVSLLRYY